MGFFSSDMFVDIKLKGQSQVTNRKTAVAQ